MPAFFKKKIEKLLQYNKKLGKPTIAFGLKAPDKEILASLRRSKKYAQIILVGPKAIARIKEFKLIISNNPEKKLASMLAGNEVAGVVRGTIDDFKTYETYQQLTGEKSTLNPGLFEDPFGRQFLMTPVGNPEGWAKKERLRLAEYHAEFMMEWGVKPKIAIFTGERHETYPRRKHIRKGVIGILNKTYEDAEWIVAELKKKGYDAKNWAIDLNPAVEDACNLLIPVNGMVGNQIFRAMHVCGGKVLFAPRLGLSRCYEDNSRTERDFEPHVRWLVAWINSKKMNTADFLKKKPSRIHGFGIFTNRPIKKGEKFYSIPPGKIFNRNMPRCAHIGNGKYVSDEKVLNWVNHSCRPNCALNISQQPPALEANSDIIEGEEITCDYRKTEIDRESFKFKCNCEDCDFEMI